MLLRHLVSQFIQSSAGRRIVEEITNATFEKQKSAASSSDPNATHPVKSKPCDIAFVFGVGVEAGGLIDLLQDGITTRCDSYLEHAGTLEGRSIVIAESGVGQKKAAHATDDLIAIHKPSCVISTGFATGLRDEAKYGHILMANSVADCTGNHYPIHLAMDPAVIQSIKGLHVDRLLTVDEMRQTPQDKRMLGEQYAAAACDMETFAVAEICQNQSVSFLSVRVISDTVDDQLPFEIETLQDQKSLASKLGATAGAIFNRPSAVKDLWKLKEDALKASDRLARFLVSVSSQL
ncbi:MAG: hypothetical protein GY768_26270 [Planctomycetaceae bacterium]|nr:hypothetical protein [Planctomycetaceae bacterium]